MMKSNISHETYPHPLIRAYQLQEHIKATEMELSASKLELADIVRHCRETKQETDGDYSIVVRLKQRSTVNPEKFAKEFPDANAKLVQEQFEVLSAEMEDLLDKGVLKNILVSNALREVGKKDLYAKACDVSTTEYVEVMRNPHP